MAGKSWLPIEEWTLASHAEQYALCRKLGIEFPLFAFSHCRDVVAAVSNAGGFGVIACGAGGHLGSAHQVAYGLVGTNCFNRTDMANSFKGLKSRDNVLRFFPGQHEWASEELCDDAITHLNGVFLFANRAAYPDDCAAYTAQVGDLVELSAKTAPLRAYMWSSFLTIHGIKEPKLAALHATLSQSEINKLYVKGLTDVSEFAQKNFGGVSGSQWKADPKVAAACKREAKKFVGTPWEEVLNLMAGDAQKF